MSKKVYCGKCRWFQSAGQGDETQPEKCMNIIGWYSTYRAKKITKRTLEKPCARNLTNTCSAYSWNWFGWRGY